MRVEFAKFRTGLSGRLEVTEVAHAGNVNGTTGELKFADGTLKVWKTDKGISADLNGLRGADLFSWRNLRSEKKIELARDGGGCVQINKEWMFVVHENGTSGIYDRLGRRDRGGYHHESYWHT